jgi:hypothetical protein
VLSVLSLLTALSLVGCASQAGSGVGGLVAVAPGAGPVLAPPSPAPSVIGHTPSRTSTATSGVTRPTTVAAHPSTDAPTSGPTGGRTGIHLLTDFSIVGKPVCGWSVDQRGRLRLSAEFEISSVGLLPAQSAPVRQTDSADGFASTGVQSVGEDFTATVTGGAKRLSSRYLGHTVTITAVVDPDNDVLELNEGNNTAQVAVNVPSDDTAVSGATQPLPCHVI